MLKGSVRRRTIGVLSDDVTNGYSEPILAELSDAAREHGVDLINFVGVVGPEDVQKNLLTTADLASTERLDALLVLPVSHEISAAALTAFCERFRPLPICSVPDVIPGFISRVSVSNEPGMRAIITHLVATHGYRRVAFVRGPAESDEAELRFAIYREVLEAHDLPFDPALVTPGNYVTQAGIDAVELLLDQRGLKPEAIACANDGMALGVLEALAARNIAVPEAIAVAGFDDIDVARYFDPPLTTVRQPLRELGRAALELLLGQLEPGRVPENRVLPSVLVLRESCGCLAHRDSNLRKTDAPSRSRSSGVAELHAHAQRNVDAIRVLGLPEAADGSWPEAIYAAFVADVEGGNQFSGELRKLLQFIARRGGDVGAVQKVVTVLWQRARHSLEAGSEAWTRADALLHTARVVTSGVGERIPTSRQVRMVDFAWKLSRTGSSLGMAVDFPQVSGVLARDLPDYGISACWLCLYQPAESQGGRHGDRARLVAGFRERLPLVLPPEGIVFSSKRILPDGFFLSAPQHIIGPLSRNDVSIGYAVFVRGPTEGFVYELLMAQLGSAVQRFVLLGRLVLEAERRQAAERERMEKELLIAQRIQSGIMPREIAVVGLEISAMMQPATEVGGDYYDVIPVANGCWIGIGDVAGHGLPTGLVMLMLQSVVAGLVRWHPEAAPHDILRVVNSVLFENIRIRMAQDEFVTLTLLHCEVSGHVHFAGAHEDILVYRAATCDTEWVATPGTWVGAIEDISEGTVDSNLKLEPGDVMVLYTDGVLEARNATKDPFGSDRLAATLQRVAKEPVEVIRDALHSAVEAWMHKQDDDLTLLVARFVGGREL